MTSAIPISFPESSFALTIGRKTRALGATISCMHIDADWAVKPDELNSVISFFILKWLLPKSLVFRPLIKGNEDSGNEIAAIPVQ